MCMHRSLMARWPELVKARNGAHSMTQELERLLKHTATLSKKETQQHNDALVDEAEDSIVFLHEAFEELMTNMTDHKERIRYFGRFLRRHYSRSSPSDKR